MFTEITENFAAAPQISKDDLIKIKEAGYGAVINNRPDAEGGTPSAEMQQAAEALGLDYIYLPMPPIQPEYYAAFGAMVEKHDKILAHCKSGMRSTVMWAAYHLQNGADKEEILQQAEKAGFQIRGAFA